MPHVTQFVRVSLWSLTLVMAVEQGNAEGSLNATGAPMTTRTPTAPGATCAPKCELRTAKFSFGDTAADRRRTLVALVREEASKQGLPPDVADAVTYIESNYNPGAVGDVGEVGLMQILPSTAAMLGFRGTDAELANPAVNIRYGVAYLSSAWRLAGGDLCRALMKYRAGHGEETMTALSVEYCRRAKEFLLEIGSNVTIKQPLASLSPWIRRGPSSRQAISGAYAKLLSHSDPAAFWAQHESRVKMLRTRVHIKWKAREQIANATLL